MMKNVFIVALITARNRGLFDEFSKIIERGQVGMKYHVDLDGSNLYLQTAGHVLQCRWLAFHCAQQEHRFTYNKAQAAFSKWIDLPNLVHDPELATTVAAWKEHALADHNESLTFVLSPRLLHAYVELQAVFHRLYLERGEARKLCTWRHKNGELCTKKRCWGAFCKAHSWKAEQDTSAAQPVPNSADIASASQPGAGDAPAAAASELQAVPPSEPQTKRRNF